MEPATLYGMTLNEMKRHHRAKQQQIRELEAERAAILERGEPTPGRLRYRLTMLRIEAEEYRLWGNRLLTRLIRDSVGRV